MKYSFDTSGILDIWRYYPPDVFTTVLGRIETLIAAGDIRAADEVLRELKKKEGDDAFKWCNSHPDMFLPIDIGVQTAVTEILAKHEHLVASGGKRSAADPFVIAVAKVNGCAVVTGELPSGRMDRPHIPDVCRAMGIGCMSFLDVLRAEGWTFA